LDSIVDVVVTIVLAVLEVVVVVLVTGEGLMAVDCGGEVKFNTRGDLGERGETGVLDVGSIVAVLGFSSGGIEMDSVARGECAGDIVGECSIGELSAGESSILSGSAVVAKLVRGLRGGKIEGVTMPSSRFKK
jgi:hypothetical protein